MLFKALFSLCVQALLVQIISAQCIPGPCNGFLSPKVSLSPALSPIAMAESMGFPRGYSPTFGSGLALSSVSPITATGISVTSENVYDGPLTVAGRLPFLSVVAVEGTVPSVGAGGVLYGCEGAGFGILSEDIAPKLGIGYGVSPGYGGFPGPYNNRFYL